MKKLVTLCVVFITTVPLLAGNTITYTSMWKLSRSSLDVGATTFGSAITSHTFSDHIGTIICSGEITTIGNLAFYNCSSMDSITIPNSVITIGDSAFYGCSNLESVIIPDSVTTIGDGAFYSCTDLTSINIPNSVTTIGYEAFYWCYNLPEENGLRYADTYLVAVAGDRFQSVSSYTIKNGTKWIGDNVFSNYSKLTSITIPNSVTTIGSQAFYGCSGLTSITIPNSVTKIGDWAFVMCSNLTSVIIGNSVETIGERAFEECSGLTSITIPNSVTTIGNLAFSKCIGLTSVTIGNSVTTIGNSAFARCRGLTSVTMGNSVTTIGIQAFHDCSGLTSITIPNSVTTIGDWAFRDCSLTSVTIGNSVTSIGDYAFAGCGGLTSVTIPNSVTTIGNGAFSNCGLTSVTIPFSVTTIGIKAFYDCGALASITCYAINPPSCGTFCVSSREKSIPVYVPFQSIDTYKQADEWKDFVNILPIAAVGISTNDIIITPSFDNVTFTWPADDQAAGYSIEITKDGVVFCTLKFNAQGQLIGIAFAPSRGGQAREMPAATMTTNGWQFTVTGLSQGSMYGYTLDVLDASQQSIQHYEGVFTTMGDIITDLYTLPYEGKDGIGSAKFIRNNQLLIRHNGNLYHALGGKVR